MTETSTATWSADDLTLFAGADQIGISTRRRDGTLRPFVPIWIVTVDGALYVRSYRGADTGSTPMTPKPAVISARPVTMRVLRPMRSLIRADSGVRTAPMIIMGRNT